MTVARTISRIATLATLAVLVAACGTTPASLTGTATSTSPSPAAAESAVHNAADTEFAQMMIIHHQGALEMATLAITQASSEEVRSLAVQISAAQGPEIDTMTGWLDAWGEDQPASAEMNAMEHEGMQMGGQDQAAVMAELATLTGDDFDRSFLQVMTEHHSGAIAMAETEVAEGSNAEALALAGRIIDAQMAEITEMSQLLSTM